jgi:hypothetical protein
VSLALLECGDASPLSIFPFSPGAEEEVKPVKAAKHRRTPKEPNLSQKG